MRIIFTTEHSLPSSVPPKCEERKHRDSSK
jgi:hypothetical protein